MAGSESGSGGSSGSGRVRSVELVRKAGAKLGFSVRGGREHATGFFVTSVEPQSEAHSQGLRAGDQIIRVNGYPVEDATHSELLQLIQAHASLLLKVRRVGMIPEKEEGSDELRWRIVEPEAIYSLNPEQLAQHSELVEQLARHNELAEQLARQTEVPLILKVPPKAKLGCGICKGPDWKPGIFVQFTKENSIARAGGLRPGDQILQCNNVLFTPDMPFNEAVSIMRSCGLLKLVVRKAAGMELFPGESSGYNSSASSVAGDHPASSWTNTTPEPENRFLDEIEAEKYGCSEGISVSNSRKHLEVGCGGKNILQDMVSGGGTIVKVGSDHHPISNGKLAEICMVSQQMETKTTTVLVEVHHSGEDSTSNSQSDENAEQLTSSSVSSNASSLRRAISQELERRSKRAAPPSTEKLIKSGLTKEEMHQHEQLMNEFRQAHHKMFSEPVKVQKEEMCGENKKVEEQKIISKTICKTQSQCDKVTKNECKAKTREESGRPRHRKHPAPQPPPPPPMPCSDEFKPKKGQAPPPPCRPPESPPCPTPDYDTLSLASDGHQSCDKVDMQSLESFRLTNPSSQKPKPPNTYFPKSSSASSNSTASTVILRDCRPLVTIREYGEGSRPQISKLDLQQQPLPPDMADQPLQHRLANELCHTLSRSNISTNNHQTLSSKNIHDLKPITGGSVIKICVENDKNMVDKTKPAPFYLFPEYKRSGMQNSVSFNLSSKQSIPLQSHPNGILKNSNISHVQIHPSHMDKPHPLKTIKFGAITTVMRDSPEPKA